MRTYRFIGAGKGVPGLPHFVTELQARLMGLETLLADALRAGTYEEIRTPAQDPPVALMDAPEPALEPEPKAEKKRRSAPISKEA